MSNKSFRRMSDSDIKLVIAELDRWALGNLGTKLTWVILEKRFKFSRQSLEAKPGIKAAYQHAKQALSGGLVKSKEQTGIENKELVCEIKRLKLEVDEFKRKELNWKKRWQRIAFHIRQKGIQVYAVDSAIPDGFDGPNVRDASNILRPFDKDIPPSGRV